MATAKKAKAAKVAPAVFEQVLAKVEEQAAVTPETPAAPKSKGLGIGALVKDLIGSGLSNDEILSRVKEQFPSASTNKACVAWYRSAMRKSAKL
jgi:beta-lactamase class A